MKILDFGLAKLEEGYAAPGSARGDKSDATLAEPFANDLLTSPGSAVGTIAYMSPEQARGETLDARSDVFSLGVVLYELPTGQHPFSGSTTAVTFDRILNYAPTAPISLNPDLPPELEETLNKTLEKDRELRLQSAAELRAELKRLQRKSSGGTDRAANGTLAGATAGSHAGSGRRRPAERAAAARPLQAPERSAGAGSPVLWICPLHAACFRHRHCSCSANEIARAAHSADCAGAAGRGGLCRLALVAASGPVYLGVSQPDHEYRNAGKNCLIRRRQIPRRGQERRRPANAMGPQHRNQFRYADS